MELQMNYDLSKIRIKCAEIVGRNCRYHCPSCKTQVNPDTVTSGGYHSSETCFGKVEEGVLPFTESADAALELVEWIAKPENGGWQFSSDFAFALPVQWNAYFYSMKSEAESHANNASLPLSICLAFLKANNIEPESL